MHLISSFGMETHALPLSCHWTMRIVLPQGAGIAVKRDFCMDKNISHYIYDLHLLQDICLLFANQRTAFPSGCDGGSRFFLLPEWFLAEPLSAALCPA